MDSKVIETLQRIGMEAAMRHKQTLVQNVKVFEQEKVAMEELAKKGDKRAKEILESGQLDRMTQVVNEEAADAIEKEVEFRIRQAIASGELPAPAHDGFQDKIADKIEKDAKDTAKKEKMEAEFQNELKEKKRVAKLKKEKPGEWRTSKK